MNENIDLTKILKDCPKGTSFYSSVHGKLYYDGMYVDSSASKIYFRSATSRSIADGSPILIIYLRDGRLYNGEGECTIFPSKDQRDWSEFEAPWYKRDRFDPGTLHLYDMVLVKDNGSWDISLFAFYNEMDRECICSAFSSYKYCIPYNDETKHLVGTKDEAPEYYRYWEN